MTILLQVCFSSSRCCCYHNCIINIVKKEEDKRYILLSFSNRKQFIFIALLLPSPYCPSVSHLYLIIIGGIFWGSVFLLILLFDYKVHMYHQIPCMHWLRQFVLHSYLVTCEIWKRIRRFVSFNIGIIIIIASVLISMFSLKRIQLIRFRRYHYENYCLCHPLREQMFDKKMVNIH